MSEKHRTVYDSLSYNQKMASLLWIARTKTKGKSRGRIVTLETISKQTGISKTRLQGIQSGTREATCKELDQISHALGCSFHELKPAYEVKSEDQLEAATSQ